MTDSLPPNENPTEPAAKPTVTPLDPVSRYDVLTAPAQSTQFSLGEILLVMFGVSLGLAAGHWLPGPSLPLVLGVVVMVMWGKLYLEDWEPRWALVAWRALLGAYCGAAFAAVVLSAT